MQQSYTVSSYQTKALKDLPSIYRPLKIVKKEVVVSGYKVYYCQNYLLTNSSLLKTLVVPCGCRRPDC